MTPWPLPSGHPSAPRGLVQPTGLTATARGVWALGLTMALSAYLTVRQPASRWHMAALEEEDAEPGPVTDRETTAAPPSAETQPLTAEEKPKASKPGIA